MKHFIGPFSGFENTGGTIPVVPGSTVPSTGKQCFTTFTTCDATVQYDRIGIVTLAGEGVGPKYLAGKAVLKFFSSGLSKDYHLRPTVYCSRNYLIASVLYGMYRYTVLRNGHRNAS